MRQARSIIRPNALLFCAIILVLAARAVGSHETSATFTGSLNAFSLQADISPTDLVPNPAPAELPTSRVGFDAILRTELNSGALTMHHQARLTGRSPGTRKVIADAAYLDLAFGRRVFIFAGRRILSFGQAFGLNPADVLRDPLREHGGYQSDFARNAAQGAEMVGMDLLFDGGAALTSLYAPGFDRRADGDTEDLAMLRFSGLTAAGSLDYAISVMSGDHPGLALSTSYGLGQASLLYVDSTIRRGREKSTIASQAADGLLTIEAPSQALQAIATLGFGHTFANRLALNLEYTHDSAGYSPIEWADIAHAIGAVHRGQNTRQRAALGQLNDLINHHTLRENYGFVRLAHDGNFGSGLSKELTLLHNLDDTSGSVGLRITVPIGDHFTLGLSAARRYGERYDEFTLRPQVGSVALTTAVNF